MSEVKVNKISPRSGTDVTLGDSGDTITIPSGATLSSTDPLVFPAGTVSLPAITTTGDTNTGIFFPAADTIAFTEGGTEAMRINSSGQVGIGTASPAVKFQTTIASSGVSGIAATGVALFENSGNCDVVIGAGTSSKSRIAFADSGDWIVGRIDYDHSDNSMRFGTNGTAERMKIGSNGQLTITTNAAGDNGMIFINANADPFGLQMDFSTASPDNNSRTFQLCEDSTTTRMIVYSDGDLANHDGVYGSISDERIKQDIRDSNSQWNDIKNIRVRNFKKKDDVRQYGDNAWEQIGVIAQELETVSPKLIKHSDPTQSDILSDSSFGTLYQEEDEIPEGKKVGDIKEVHDQIKKVSYSVLYMKSIKALQEAMERIETLEAKVTTLENN
jgi:hypothetical protein